jgi:hypothetical protein
VRKGRSGGGGLESAELVLDSLEAVVAGYGGRCGDRHGMQQRGGGRGAMAHDGWEEDVRAAMASGGREEEG